MKKFITAIVAVLYISTSTGAILHMHYCMGQLADWGLGHNNSTTCGKCGMEKSDEKDNGCCKDEHKFLKNNSDQKTAETGFQIIQLSSTVLPVSFFEILSFDFLPLIKEYPISHSPPRSGGVAVYVRNCTFLI